MNLLFVSALCCCALTGSFLDGIAPTAFPGGVDAYSSRPRVRLSFPLPEGLRRFISGISNSRPTQASTAPSEDRRLGANKVRPQVSHAMGRFLLWCVVLAALPWLTGFATHAAVEKKSNWASAFLLAGYTAANTVLYFCIFAFRAPTGAWFWLFLCVLVLAFVYDYRTCDRIATQ